MLRCSVPAGSGEKTAFRVLCVRSYGLVSFSRRHNPQFPCMAPACPVTCTSHALHCRLHYARLPKMYAGLDHTPARPPIEDNQTLMKQTPTHITLSFSDGPHDPNTETEGHDSSPWQRRPCPQQAFTHCTPNPERKQPCTHVRSFLLCDVFLFSRLCLLSSHFESTDHSAEQRLKSAAVTPGAFPQALCTCCVLILAQHGAEEKWKSLMMMAN